MDNYDWEKNKAIVDRMYYCERVLLATTLFAAFFTSTNMLYIKKGFFAEHARSRLFPTFKYWALINGLTIPVLLRPLTKEEMTIQWRKRLIMGKYLYTLYHMEEYVKPDEVAK
jgi:hypothetical protein